jgi:hypothetical protein
MANVLMAGNPCWHKGYRVFDDDSAGLDKEPFVRGIPEMIDDLVRNIPDAGQGFKLVFSARPFSSYQRYLIRVREEMDGWWYKVEDGSSEGWLCPALFKYFEVAPERIYFMAETATDKAQKSQSQEIDRLKARRDELEQQVARLDLEQESLKRRTE